MVRPGPLLESFEREQIRERKGTFAQHLALFEALFREARSLGVFPLKDPLEGIEVDIRLARAFNVRASLGEDQQGLG